MSKTSEIILHNDPKVSIQENLFTKQECQHLINLGKPHLENSVVSDSKEDIYRLDAQVELVGLVIFKIK